MRLRRGSVRTQARVCEDQVRVCEVQVRVCETQGL